MAEAISEKAMVSLLTSFLCSLLNEINRNKKLLVLGALGLTTRNKDAIS